MKILFVWPVCTFSVWDVARGYRAALGRLLGEENIKDYYLHKHLAYHQKAMPESVHNEVNLSKFASETILNEALYFETDLVLINSGLNLHPVTLWALRKVGIPTATIMTESPYEDANQKDWADVYPEMKVVTTEKISAVNGWTYIPHAYDPEVHHPMPYDESKACDVVMIGTGWNKRRHLLEQINWTGIDLKLYGLWKGIEDSCLFPFYQGFSIIDNETIGSYYTSASVCLNLHRFHATAQSMNPRAYEIAACGAYQICDKRQEVGEVFGDTVPQVETPGELEHEIRWALANPEKRQLRASYARDCVQEHTFDNRAARLLAALGIGRKPSENDLERENGLEVRAD